MTFKAHLSPEESVELHDLVWLELANNPCWMTRRQLFRLVPLDKQAQADSILKDLLGKMQDGGQIIAALNEPASQMLYAVDSSCVTPASLWGTKPPALRKKEDLVPYIPKAAKRPGRPAEKTIGKGASKNVWLAVYNGGWMMCHEIEASLKEIGFNFPKNSIKSAISSLDAQGRVTSRCRRLSTQTPGDRQGYEYAVLADCYLPAGLTMRDLTLRPVVDD